METTRQDREREFHNRTFAEDSRRGLDRVYAILHDSKNCYRGYLAAHCAGKDVLEYGCGPGGHSRFLAEHGARLTGIDISDVAVRQATERASAERFQATFRVMDAERLDFPDNSFDLICSVAILHHLDLQRAFSELARVLRPAGSAIFLEPLGHNPIINLYRTLTPHLRSADEHPLLMKDLKLAGSYFDRVESRFFVLHSLLAVPFTKAPFFIKLVTGLEAIDRALFRFVPFARRYAWETVLSLAEPRKPQGTGNTG